MITIDATVAQQALDALEKLSKESDCNIDPFTFGRYGGNAAIAALRAALTEAPDLPTLTDSELTKLYDKANGHESGKLHPITTVKIFKAMRACLAIAQPAKLTSDQMADVTQYLESWGCLAHSGVAQLIAWGKSQAAMSGIEPYANTVQMNQHPGQQADFSTHAGCGMIDDDLSTTAQPVPTAAPVAWQSAVKGDVSAARLYFDKDEPLIPLYPHPSVAQAIAQPATVGAVELTAKQIEQGWKNTFSTNNPFCPCDLKSFTKAVRWAERAAIASKGAQK